MSFFLSGFYLRLASQNGNATGTLLPTRWHCIAAKGEPLTAARSWRDALATLCPKRQPHTILESLCVTRGEGMSEA